MTTPFYPQHVAILGAGESGVGAALLARARGLQVFVSSLAPIAPEAKAELEQAGIDHEEGGHSLPRLLQAQAVIKSPGIAQTAPVVQALRQAGLPVWSEIEFAARHCTGHIIAITGTNGKTTTTEMVGGMLQHAGLDAVVCGNIGTSFARRLAQADHAWWVLEVSSFQLEDIEVFRPHIAVITNLSRNHLDRYDGSMERYGAAKLNIARNQTPNDHFIYSLDSPDLVGALARSNLAAHRHGFSLTPRPDAAAHLDSTGHFITLNLSMSTFKTGKRIPLDLKQPSTPNKANALAASVVGALVDLRKEAIRESLAEFTNSPHRLEDAGTVNGRVFINDSKATNVNATWFALESMDKPVVWIVGGVDKGNDYGMILDLVKQKVKTIVMLGKQVDRIRAAFEGQVDQLYHATSMEEAVNKAYQFAAEGEAVLLSPACASFDLFQDYEDRGNRFKKVVKSLR